MYLGFDSELEAVEEAENGQEGLRMTRRFRPDVVLMDLLVLVIPSGEPPEEALASVRRLHCVVLGQGGDRARP
jgi:DNA-binding NarL/FixJ family response regulator